jgi:hypothetical protein
MQNTTSAVLPCFRTTSGGYSPCQVSGDGIYVLMGEKQTFFWYAERAQSGAEVSFACAFEGRRLIGILYVQ